MLRFLASLLICLLPAWGRAAETVPASPPRPPAPAGSAVSPVNQDPLPAAVIDEDDPSAGEEEEVDEEEAWVGDLFQLGQTLFEQFAPEEIKERYRFPTKEEWDAFAVRLQQALESNSLSRLADMEPEARAALLALRALPDYAEYADWLEERLDDMAVAQQVSDATAAVSPPAEPTAPTIPPPLSPSGSVAAVPPGKSTEPPVAAPPTVVIPLYDVWLARMQTRRPPERAARLVPRLKPAFQNASVPPALVWLAETESSFNPAARSPVGARGLFQLMPGTAKDLGLRLLPFDERLDPLKSAASAARYLHQLHTRFQDWPLALAAYNAGPGRVSRLLKQHEATTFAEIAEVLPSETRLYVPKVLATIAVREGVFLATMTTTLGATD
jgi:membrane-bound lytic murein transglycosylase D